MLKRSTELRGTAESGDNTLRVCHYDQSFDKQAVLSVNSRINIFNTATLS